MTSIVADASCVAAALVASDSSRPWASALLRSAELVHVPHLMQVEAISRLRKAELHGLCSASRADEAVQSLMEMPLQVWPLEGLHSRVWSLRQKVTAYDAWYVALAEYLELPLATCDVRLARANGPTCAFLTAP
ncbi:MAG: type II toxin-antitoxin system VapC family toxin [Polyangiales bacterium]